MKQTLTAKSDTFGVTLTVTVSTDWIGVQSLLNLKLTQLPILTAAIDRQLVNKIKAMGWTQEDIDEKVAELARFEQGAQ